MNEIIHSIASLADNHEFKRQCSKCQENFLGEPEEGFICTRCSEAIRSENQKIIREQFVPPIFRKETDWSKIPETIKNWSAEKGKGILIVGTPQKGKSHAAWQLCKKEKLKGNSVNALSSHDLACRIAVCCERGSGQLNELILNLKAVSVLFVDDLDKAKFTERVVSEFFEILNYRIEHQKPTIITSNSKGKELQIQLGNAGEAIVARLRNNQYFTIITL
jgi:DNA replication protein DnaC